MNHPEVDDRSRLGSFLFAVFAVVAAIAVVYTLLTSTR